MSGKDGHFLIGISSVEMMNVFILQLRTLTFGAEAIGADCTALETLQFELAQNLFL
jgi:hypothetical protein